MKKRILFRSLIMLSVISLCLLACKQENVSGECETCTPLEPNLKKTVTINSNSEKISMDSKIWADRNVPNYQFASINIKNLGDFDRLVKLMEINNIDVGIDKIVSLTLFSNGLLSEKSNLNRQDFFAFSIYSFNENNQKLIHRYFQLINNEIKENAKLFGEVDGIIVNHIHNLASLFSSDLKKHSSLSIIGPLFADLKLDNLKSYDQLSFVLKNYKKDLANNDFGNLVEPSGEGRCPFPCPSNPENRTCETTYYGSYKCKGTCVLRGSTEQSDVINFWNNTDSLTFLVKEQGLYDFRDNILSQNLFGQKYITYYYDMSDEFKGKIDLNTIISTLRLMPKVYDCMNKISNSSENVNTIVMSNSDKNDFVNIINIYKTKTTNSSIISKLDDIILDLNNIVNQNVVQVRNRFSTP